MFCYVGWWAFHSYVIISLDIIIDIGDIFLKVGIGAVKFVGSLKGCFVFLTVFPNRYLLYIFLLYFRTDV